MGPRVEEADAPARAVTAPRRRAGTAGRAGAFVAGFVALYVVNGVFAGIVGGTSGLDDASQARLLVVGAASAGMVAALLAVARRLRHTDHEPFGVMAAFGAAQYIGLAAYCVSRSAGLDGRPLFWAVLVLALPSVVAVLLWLPHPVLGLSVGVGVVAAVAAAPIGIDGAAGVATRALIIGVCALALAVVVELRTLTRAGSFLHYLAVVAFAVATIAGTAATSILGEIALTGNLALLELIVAVLMQRRSWSYLAWISLTFSLFLIAAWMLSGLGSNVDPPYVVAPLLIVASIWMRRHEDPVRAQLLATIPPGLAARFDHICRV